MGIFLISPVRKISKREKKYIENWLEMMEKTREVHWPKRDTNQNDPIGLKICEDNAKAILKNLTTMVWWNEKSEGSIFDFGMAFMLAVLGKMLKSGELTLEKLGEFLNGRYGRFILVPSVKKPKKTNGKSFNNVLLALDEKHGVL